MTYSFVSIQSLVLLLNIPHCILQRSTFYPYYTDEGKESVKINELFKFIERDKDTDMESSSKALCTRIHNPLHLKE